ncbi:cilia- and flagella-associated protein 97 isoform X2 [Trichomycterus rosablanca]
MYSPKELEGEVDHSFFDSDCEAGNTISQDLKDGENNNKKEPNEAGAETSKLNGKVQEGRIKQTENEDATNEEKMLEKELSRLDVQSEKISEISPECMDTIRKEECSHQKSVRAETKEVETKDREDPSDRRDETGKDKKDESEREDSDASSRRSSPLPCSDGSVSSRGSKSDDSSSLCSYSESSAEEDDAVFKNEDDGDRRSDPDSRRNEDRKSSKTTPKKTTSKFRQRSLSHSASSSSGENSPTPSHQPSAAQHNVSPRRQPRTGSGKQKERKKSTETLDSEDTITDVTPLSTPEVSPRQLVDLALPSNPVLSNEALVTADGPHQKDVAEKDSGKAKHSDTDDEKGSAVSKGSRPMDRLLQVSSPGCASISSSRSSSSRQRKNYSFTSDEVRRIERENQRLLLQLSRSPSRSLSRSTNCSTSPPVRLYHTTLNRQKEQQRIQKENLAFLKRLESVKPTPGMTRSEQLADYQRQAGYLGIHAPPTRPSSGKSSRPCSTTRPDTAKPSRTTAPRPAWS